MRGILTTVSTKKWVVSFKPRPQARLRLFCFPYAGGGTSIFSSWPDALPAQIEVCPIQLPGREGRFLERPYSSLERLLPDLTEALRPMLDLPFVFFGYSMGAVISYELTQRLRKENAQLPLKLLISAYPAPHIPRYQSPIHQLSDQQFIERLRSYAGTPEEVLKNGDVMRLIMPMLRADFTLIETYAHSPQPPLDCPITVVGGRQDPHATEDKLAAWREHTTGRFSLRMYEGNHFFIQTMRLPVLQFFSDELLAVLVE